MKVGVTGHTGFVGSRLVKSGYQPIEVDITDIPAVKAVLLKEKFDTIVHCAAASDVEHCQHYPSQASKINVAGTMNLINWFRGTFIYISTDHVFNGAKFFGGGYSEKHSPSPVNMYGLTKLAGETMSKIGRNNTKIIRTSKLFDYDKLQDILGIVDAGGEVTVTNVLRRSFLHVDHFVEGLRWVVENSERVPEILNISGTDMFTYYNFYLAVLKHLEMDVNKLLPRNTLLKIATPRPIRGGLNVSTAKKLGVPLYSGLDGIKLL